MFVEFDVTLVFLESHAIPATLIDTKGFASIKVLPVVHEVQDIFALALWIKEQAYDFVFYPAVGMHAADIILSNVRLAPVQLTSYGHPASTQSKYIDYFIGGAATEVMHAAFDLATFSVLLPVYRLTVIC